MQKFAKTLSCVFVFIFCIMMFSACSNKPTSPDGEDLLVSYKARGYYEISSCNYIEANAVSRENVVTVQGKTLYKSNSKITLSLSEENLEIENFTENFISLSLSKAISGFSVGGKIVNIQNVNGYTFSIKKDIVISTVFKNFDIMAASIYTSSPYNENLEKFLSDKGYLSKVVKLENNTIISTDRNFLFTGINEFEPLKNNASNVSMSNDNLANIDVTFEIPSETTEVYFVIIIKYLDNTIDFINSGKVFVSSHAESLKIVEINSSTINKIIISTTDDLSTSNDYKK